MDDSAADADCSVSLSRTIHPSSPAILSIRSLADVRSPAFSKVSLGASRDYMRSWATSTGTSTITALSGLGRKVRSRHLRGRDTMSGR